MNLGKETDRHWQAVLAFFFVVAISQIFPQWSNKGSNFSAGGKKKQRI
jgi:hypothetical protein